MPSDRYDPYDPDQIHDRSVEETVSLANARQDAEWARKDLEKARVRDRNLDELGMLTSEVSDSTGADAIDEDTTDDLQQPVAEPFRSSLADLFGPPIPDWARLGKRATELPTSDRSPPPDRADAIDEDTTDHLQQPVAEPFRSSLADLFGPPIPDWARLGKRATELPTSDRSPPPDRADAT